MNNKTTQYKEIKVMLESQQKGTLLDNLYSISKKDLKVVSRVLGDAFSKDPIIDAVDLKGEDINTMYEIFVRCGLRYGNVYATSKNLEGIMVTLPSKYGIMRMWHVIRSGAIFPAIKLRKKFTKEMQENFRVMDEEKKNLDIGPYIYLGILGVAQKNQGMGYGGKMLQALIEKSETKGLPIFLETETEENVSLYNRFGFEVRKKIILPAMNLPLWLMVRYCKNNK